MDTITSIAIADLHESPFNPRRTFSESGLTELAADVRAQGILSPLLVRPRIPELFRGMEDAADTAACGFELVFGHRRLRAAKLAGLEHVPCMVRSMTDPEARRAQISENLSREDLHPYEEGEGFAALIRDHGVTVDELHAQTGKSTSYIYGRLKLANLIDAARDAFLAGQYSTEIALRIARVPPKLQVQAMTVVKEQGYQLGRGERNIRNELIERFTLDLKSAIFDPEAADLLPSAGACSACPKLSGNAPEFADAMDGNTNGQPDYVYLKAIGPNTCTDPGCFADKKAAHLRNVAAAIEAEGKAVINGAKARQVLSAEGKPKGDYVKASEVRAAIKKAGRTSKPLVQVAIDQRTGKSVEVVKKADLVQLGLMDAKAAEKPSSSSRAYDYAKERADREARAKEHTERNERLLHAIRSRQDCSAPSLFELRAIVLCALEDADCSDYDLSLCKLQGVERVWELRDRVGSSTPDQLVRLLLDTLMCRDVEASGYEQEHEPPDLLFEMAEHYGVDAEAVMAGADEPADEAAEVQAPAIEPATPTPAARAPKKAKAAPARALARYANPVTGDTWSGRGLQPAWIKAALAQGKTLTDFERKAVDGGTNQTDDAGAAGGADAQQPAEMDAA